ncbi:epoxide hydrolase 1 [Pyricularia oryzae 70-15]|uniref:Epoxide hydrolase 1 n=3 Tax=Pyricularia oryzae TaxID=318829 RepID=Q2KEW6_PYRO7|nr:epoxide hydrolase 1 [Pyricularia oryzae 70-15]ELQ41300.1 epoxide hydrolase 1 [Pyricularia oryzae Y34]KAI6581260.1 hypothetical protein MCOR12_011448 [Pyricularia oryzae]EAQ71513.1 hypothetical protein MGCH7_ch7g920 [Pyricularia oryzae 70-15]KAI7913803.1 hypothetical protein M9X92_009262 [Pyricularia oryzae]KAI7914309.1 hypothetical protein M0657_009555 [Pyricularia oryzae]
MSVTPYKINVPEDKITRLKQKLAAAELPDELEDAGWDMGSPLADVKRLAKYWRDEFDWRQAEAELNQMPQFTTTMQIEGFDPIELHFVHAKSSRPNAVPLLFCHGWPGSFEEVSKLLPLLVDGGGSDDKPAFDVVAPSLPGFGFSSGVKKRGFSAMEMAEVSNKLMTEVLGYDQYVTQGGDLGYFVTRCMGYSFPEHCRASHYNVAGPQPPSETYFPELYKQDQAAPRTQAELEGLARSEWFQKEGSGYRMLHMSKPQTPGYALTDSPVGLLAWIYEKLHDWSDGCPFTDYDVCKWVSIYWFSRAGPAASLRIYYEMAHETRPVSSGTITFATYLEGVKLGFGLFPKDLAVLPLLWNKTLGDVVLNKLHESGGHFASFERPQELAADLYEMFGQGGAAYAVVKGRTGYA